MSTSSNYQTSIWRLDSYLLDAGTAAKHASLYPVGSQRSWDSLTMNAIPQFTNEPATITTRNTLISQLEVNSWQDNKITKTSEYVTDNGTFLPDLTYYHDWAARIRADYKLPLYRKVQRATSHILHMLGPQPLFSSTFVITAIGLSYGISTLI